MPTDFSVLIVEDDEDARRNMEDILSLDEHRVTTVSHCTAAIAAIEQQPFDAVIVDWKLPDENADQLIPIIVKRQPNTPVVVVTGLRDFDTAVTALRSGAYDFLLKPINPDALRSVLSRMVERKRHIDEIEMAHEKLLMNERLAAIGQMVAGLAHESRNAFQRSHACLAELALDLESDPINLGLVKKVQKALDDLHFLFEEVRAYSAPIILEKRNCNLRTLITGTWQQVVDAQHARTLPQFHLHESMPLPDQCYLDGNRLGQVLRNLFENAVFASPEQGVIEVRVSRDGNHTIRIEVIDEGTGVEASDRQKIFAPFFTTKTKGTGLGLAVSKRFVDAHGGKFFVESADKGGAKFVVTLPQ